MLFSFGAGTGWMLTGIYVGRWSMLGIIFDNWTS